MNNKQIRMKNKKKGKIYCINKLYFIKATIGIKNKFWI